MNSAARSDAGGFSLVELTIALAVTLLVTGAIYGLLTGGQSAFRREPELTERQANIRVAMDLIMKDIGNAGSGLPAGVQVFTRALDAAAGAPMGLASVPTDELEMITNDGGRDNEPLCRALGTDNASDIRLARNVMPVPSPPAWPQGPMVVLFADGTWTMRYVTGAANGAIVAGETNCTAGNPTALTFAAAGDPTGLNGGASPANTCTNSGAITATGTPSLGNAGSGTTGCTGPPAAGACCTAVELAFANVVRYRIRNSPTDGVPELQRYTTANAAFVTVARGIEDMQVQYTQADGTLSPGGASPNGAPVVTPGNFNTMITQVQVTLSSRSEARNISGMTADANLGTRLRGQLTYTGSPRAALISLANQGGGTLWR
jgi:Tfp pilus assembly protein PilW